MNSPLTRNTTNHPRGHPTEFEQIITEKNHNFVGRNFVFTAINEFIHRYHRGYFTIIGAPGSGKSAILAKYALDNLDVVYYNIEVAGKNRADEFLRNICTQLIEMFAISLDNQPKNTTEFSWFLSLLLHHISEQLAPNQKLIIAIDGLNFIDLNSQSPGTNLYYLPRYLPDKVYVLLTRRPFLREKSGLLIEAPSQSLNLGDYEAENRRDIQAYIQNHLTLEEMLPTPLEGELKSWLSNHNISEQEFCDRLTAKSENNFIYVSQVLTAIAEGFYSEPFPDNQTPPGLATYYQQHLQQMLPGDGLSVAVLNALVQQQPTIVDAIAHTIDADEYDVEEILENWHEFLHQEQIAGETHYRLYHSNFRDWLKQKMVSRELRDKEV